MKKVYDFKTQLARGKIAENKIDEYFKKWWNITTLTVQEEMKLGTDRIWANKKTGKRYSVEYKFDEKSKETGNIFLETVSQKENNKLGWVLTSTAQILILYLPPYAYRLNLLELRKDEEYWKEYKEGTCKNKNYHSIGKLMPVKDLERYNYKKFEIGEI